MTNGTQAWHNCYNEPWGDNLTPQSMSHPAKMSRALSRKIYGYAIERGWLKVGDTVLDPFGGIGGTCLDALANGINWVGCELERRFVDMGAGVECTGISKTDWIRFYGRWERANYADTATPGTQAKDGRHWCPRCLAEARQISPASLGFTLSLFGDDTQSAAYTRNSGIIPETKAHYYQGNLDLFRKYAKGGAWGVLVQGDSRNLVEIVRGQVSGTISSPPYASSLHLNESVDKELARMERRGLTSAISKASRNGQFVSDSNKGYGSSEGQLSALPAGNLSAAISSPPFAGNSGGRGEASRNGIDPALFERHSGGMVGGTGDDPDNLAHLPVRGFEAAIGSPPYLHPAKTGETKEDSWSDGRSRPVGASQRNNNGYGSTNGQLGAMPAGELELATSISSPPFENVVNTKDQKYVREKRLFGDYGNSAGQLGQESKETFWQAARQIVEQVFCLLKPDGVTIWVCKDFVRDGQRVHFCDQWRQLCEACGFEHVETFHAMLVKDNGKQATLEGGEVHLTTSRKSFFRRLAERNGSPAIDYEQVIVLRKPI